MVILKAKFSWMCIIRSDSERDGCNLVQRNDSVRTESSYKLLEENMSLLDKLKLKEDICR